MNWKLKAFVLRQLSRLPAGKSCYLTTQKLLGTTRAQPQRDLTRACELLEMIHESGQTVSGSICYEIGTGWHPFTPLALYLAGAREVITVDVNPWLSLRTARQAIAAAGDFMDWFAEQAHLDPVAVRRRYERIALQAPTLTELLSSMRCRYIYPGDARASGLAAESIDFVVSSNVLEHIPYGILQEIAVESLRILKPGGLFAHRYNPGDHYANDDRRVSTIHFLQFSPQEWEKYGAGLAYHNRLRCSQYTTLFTELGYLPLIVEKRIDPQALELLTNQKLQVHADFAGFTPEDLAADYMWVAGMKPNITAEFPNTPPVREASPSLSHISAPFKAMK